MLHPATLRAAPVIGAVLLVLLGVTSRAEAQELPRIEIGERIRFTSAAQPRWIAGTLVARHADTLVVEFSRGSPPAPLLVDTIWRLDAYRPRPVRILSYTLAGAAAGGILLGSLMAILPPAPCFGACSPTTWSDIVDAAAAGAVLGAIPGAMLGSYVVFLRPWQRVRLPYAGGAGTPRNGEVALAATVPF